MNIGFYSPLPPARTGVADYADQLARALAPHIRLRMNQDGDVNLYQIGNNHLHRDIYRRAIERPGVVVLHDALLHHFFLGTLDQEAYAAEFQYNYGSWYASLARDLYVNRSRSGTDPRYFEFSMLKRITEGALEVVVHNEAARRVAGRGVVIPHLFQDPRLDAAMEGAERARRELGVPQNRLLVGVFGHLREAKRVMSVLRAVDQVRRSGKLVDLLLAGDFVSRDLERAVALSGIPHKRMAYLPEMEFWRFASAVDVCVNLRYPGAGETSGIGIRFMGIGKAVILTRNQENEEFPEDACLRVDPGSQEQEMLTAYLSWLADERHHAATIGDRARRHILANHQPDQVASRLLPILRRAASATGTGKTPEADRA